MAYPSTREDSVDRTLRRADVIRARLGWKPGILNGQGHKPKWMRWRTFADLVDEQDVLVRRWVGAMKRQFGEVGAGDFG